MDNRVLPLLKAMQEKYKGFTGVKKFKYAEFIRGGYAMLCKVVNLIEKPEYLSKWCKAYRIPEQQGEPLQWKKGNTPLPVTVKEQPSTEGLNLQPGDELWVVERGDWGIAEDISGMVYLGQVPGAMIGCPYVGLGECSFEDIVQDHLDTTVKNGYTEVGFYPVSDCYATKDQAEAALQQEAGGGSDS